MPELAALELLVAVAEQGSLGAAGRALGLSQQAVSSRVASLEARTGLPLVVRTAQGSQLTSAGRIVVAWADRLLTAAEEVDAGLASLRAGSRSRIRVSASLTVAEQLLPGWLVSLRDDATRRSTTPPDVVLTATNTEHVLEAVRTGTADIGFVEGARAPTGLRSTVVGQDELAVVVPPDHPWARRSRPVTAAELNSTPLVTREHGSGTREVLDAALDALLGADRGGVEPALELSTTAAVRAAVLAGAGPAVLSRLAVADDLVVGRLRAVRTAGLELGRDLRAVWAGGRVPPAGAARDLLAHIASVSRRR